MPTLYITCGLPFSGKSYLSKKIAEHLKCNLLSYDELWREKKGETGRSLGWEELSSLAKERIMASLQAGQSIVYDTLNDTFHNREELRELAKGGRAHTVVIYLNTPQEVLQQRQAENIGIQERHDVAEDKLEEAHQRFEPPNSEERVVEFLPTDDLAVWLDNLSNHRRS